MSYTGRESWEEYKVRLESYGYTEEELPWIKEVRDSYEYMTAEQFHFLFLSGIIKRIVKNKKPRNYFTNGDDIVYLNHYLKQFQKAGHFINENEE